MHWSFSETNFLPPAMEVSVWGLWQLAHTGALLSLVRNEAWTGDLLSCSSAWHWRHIAEDLLLNCSRLRKERDGCPCPCPENSPWQEVQLRD
jgi:hypothetical protein